jgi:choline dehydrogenase-like flavoprotein
VEYRVDGPRRLDLAKQQATDGFHQMGTTRMGLSPTTSVVDANCRVHGIENLFVASTSVFPTSGQANPTFLGVAMAFRLGRFLSSRHQRQLANALNQIGSPHLSRDGMADAN